MLTCIPLGAVVIDSLLPYVLAQAIGTLGTNQQELHKFLWLATGLGILGALLNVTGFQAMVRHESEVLSRLRQSTFAELLGKDHHFFTNQKIGAMTSKFIDFNRAEVSLQDLFIIRTLGFVLSLATGLALLASQSVTASLIIAGLVVLLAIEIRWSAKVRAPWRHERKRLISEIHGVVADALTNNLIVRSFAGETREKEALRVYTERFGAIYRKDIGFVTVEGSTRVALMVATQIIAIAFAAQLVSSGSMNLATAIFMLAYLQRIGSQLFVLGDIINGYDNAFLEASPMTDMLLSKNQVDDKPSATTLDAPNPSITFDSVGYRYADGKTDVINDISVDIAAGQKVGLVGHSGAGKSTIVQLLLRFSDATSGRILIDGHDLRDVTQQSLREHIAYVPQEPMLFHRSIRDNIAYGNPDATDEQIIEAARRANALEFIEQLSHGFNTTVGERGVKLSGGQKQRVAIARAILKDAPILVLDEATSALDSESEKLIQDSLVELMYGRTSIVIAHRLSTIAKLDRILVLEDGKVVEDGTHAELLKASGIYAGLWAHQSGGFIEE
jgi:ATP-binding cassette subfamily B protein